MAFEDFYNRVSSLPGKRYDDFMEQTRRYQEGEIGVGDQMLQGGANALGLLTIKAPSSDEQNILPSL